MLLSVSERALCTTVSVAGSVGLSPPFPLTLEVKQTDVSPDAEITSPTEQSTVTFSSVGTGLLTSMPLLLVEEVCHDSMPAAMSRSRSLAPLSART